MSETLPPPAPRGWWFEEAIAQPELDGPEAPALHGDATADVVILGGGYTGMWTAWFLIEREPGIDVVLLEADVCGGGPSGRNGGFVNALYDDAEELIARHGDEGRRAVELAGRSIDELAWWCDRHGVDAWFERAGQLGVSTNAVHDEVVRATVESAERVGYGDVYRPLSTEQVHERFGSPVARIGFHVTCSATVQPARLARGLRRELIQRGVRIFERTPVRRFRASGPEAETPNGTVRARRAVIGLNAWARGWRAFRRSLLLRGTFIVLTAPAPDRLADLRWTEGEGVYDMRAAVHYLRTTPDGRIAFGGAAPAIGSQAGSPAYGYDARSVTAVARDFHRWFPTFADVPLDAAWGGPVDLSGLHLPFFGTLPGGTTHYGLGFAGNGVSPCHLGGKVLSGLVLDVEDESTTLPLVDGDRRRFPPAPFVTIGERLVSRAIAQREDRLDAGRRPGPVTEALARLPRRVGYRVGP